jgi:Pyridoxamine 5'-phosphate oxidase
MYQGAACDRTEPGSGLGGPHDRREASRTPFTVLQLATSGLDGAPKVRRVILRGAVSFFTDVRSAKIEEIRHPPRGSLLGYDADAGFQMRLEGKAAMDTQGREKAAAWASCRSQPGRSSSIRCLPGPRSPLQPKRARRRCRWREAFRRDRGLGHPYWLARYLSISAPAWARRPRLAWRLGFNVGDAPCCREARVGSATMFAEMAQSYRGAFDGFLVETDLSSLTITGPRTATRRRSSLLGRPGSRPGST